MERRCGEEYLLRTLAELELMYDVSALGLSGAPGLLRYITVAVGGGYNVTALVLKYGASAT